MSTRSLLSGAAARLAAAGVDSPDHDAAELLAHVLGVRRGSLVTAAAPTPEQLEDFETLLARRADRVPLQHLTGSAGFRYVELRVGAGVFVPRPETEVVAGYAIDRAREALDHRREPVVVDLCTGSGAIALAIATEVPQARVHAVELDPSAVPWAERNLAGSGVVLREGDMAEAFPELDGTVDVVVSNPPYIPHTAWESVTPEVRDHDPALALWSTSTGSDDGGETDDGLDAVRVVEVTAARLLRPGGVVVVEHADAQGETAPAVFRRTGRWREVADRRDLAGRPRFVTAVRATQ